ncbi:MAG TPA: LmbE family protein, partial [Leeuwenhoekiella sp.]|nr:LmbE family protein [Leeuwenhoekiella sp.]
MRFLFVFICCISLQLQAQKPKKPTSSEIYEQIQGLNFLGTALYLAAHPDDENTAMISYLANEVHARTGYLALTRGDGGQNLIGPEIRELLGVIRTQELLAARRTDGGEQRFTRANDFGYSKNPEETLSFWEEDEIMKDVVWAIRNFRPDIIINRFDHRSPGTTHGHHTLSAMLSVEAFDKVGDPQVFPEQLKRTQTWQPKRLFFNTSWWFYGSR